MFIKINRHKIQIDLQDDTTGSLTMHSNPMAIYNQSREEKRREEKRREEKRGKTREERREERQERRERQETGEDKQEG